MEKVTVTTTGTHIDDQGITRKIGEVYETAKNYAGLRKGSGLVDFDGEGVSASGEPLFDTGKKAAPKKAAAEKTAPPKKVAVKKAAPEKVKAPAATPEKVEGSFPGSSAKPE